MSGGKGRGVIQIIIKNFIESLKPRQLKGDKMGADEMGNSYFEIKRKGGRRASRWFEPKEKEDFMTEMPAEWESWLRHRRGIGVARTVMGLCHSSRELATAMVNLRYQGWSCCRMEPPTTEEIEKNVAIMMTKKENAERLERERLAESGTAPDQLTERGPDSFPKYPEYQIGGAPRKK